MIGAIPKLNLTLSVTKFDNNIFLYLTFSGKEKQHRKVSHKDIKEGERKLTLRNLSTWSVGLNATVAECVVSLSYPLLFIWSGSALKPPIKWACPGIKKVSSQTTPEMVTLHRVWRKWSECFPRACGSVFTVGPQLREYIHLSDKEALSLISHSVSCPYRRRTWR